jgi:hypothetical protein
MPFSVYPLGILPAGFTYPAVFLEIAASLATNSFYPWWFVDADSEAGRLFWKTRNSDGRNLIPFAKTDELDDIACFDGDDVSGDPRVLMITSTHDRCYSFSSFSEWLRIAQRDSVEIGPIPLVDPATKRSHCRIIAISDLASCQVTGLGEDSTRIPLAAVPADLRRANAAFWILRRGEQFDVFRHESDSEPAGSGTWRRGDA